MSDSDTSSVVEKALRRFHQKCAKSKVESAVRDDGLADQVRRAVNERDHLFHLATEMLATILLERNRSIVPEALRFIAETGWKAQIEAIGAGRTLTAQELEMALAVSGIDIQQGYVRLQKALDRYSKKKAVKSKVR